MCTHTDKVLHHTICHSKPQWYVLDMSMAKCAHQYLQCLYDVLLLGTSPELMKEFWTPLGATHALCHHNVTEQLTTDLTSLKLRKAAPYRSHIYSSRLQNSIRFLQSTLVVGHEHQAQNASCHFEAVIIKLLQMLSISSLECYIANSLIFGTFFCIVNCNGGEIGADNAGMGKGLCNGYRRGASVACDIQYSTVCRPNLSRLAELLGDFA